MSEYYTTDEGFLVILSGSSEEKREYAGVGFIVAPWFRSSIIGFCQASRRYACLKFKISGGKAAVISAYAPHGGLSWDKRFAFFYELNTF